MKYILFILSLLALSIAGAVETQITGDVNFQSGSGVPSHASSKGSIYSDTANGKVYCNTDGSTAWVVLGSPAMTLIAEGSTSVAADVEVVLATFTIADTLVPDYGINLTDDIAFHIYEGDCSNAPPTDHAIFCIGKTTTANQYELRMRHKDGGSASRTFKWKIFSK